MKHLSLLTKAKVKTILNKRTGETKFGERIKILSNALSIYDQLKDLDVRYVIFGINEDIGIQANHGKPGAYNAFDTTIKILLNTQHNAFNQGNKVCVLGTLEFDDLYLTLEEFEGTPKERLQLMRKMVVEIDKVVTELVHTIVGAGKVPIAIGGGHNNAYGLLKGSSLALKKPLHCINFDAHSDLRSEEGRHSGNGFTYAKSEGFLSRYSIFGLHENYTSQAILEYMDAKKERISYCTYEEIQVRKEKSAGTALKEAVAFIGKGAFGIEIDCDAIKHVPSSAKTPSGFSVLQTRRFVSQVATVKTTYLHICEAAPSKKDKFGVGKLISYLITDFIKAREKI